MVGAITSELLQAGIGLFFDIIDILLSLLPAAPFAAILATIEDVQFLGYVNYFIPFQFCAQAINRWLVCVIAYYIYRFLKQAVNDYRSSAL